MSWIGKIVSWAIEAKKFVYLVLLGLILIGILGLWKMKKDEFPTLEIVQGLVAGVYPGASAEQVERELTKPLEEVLMGCPEVVRDKIKSVSKDGICYIFVTLDVDGSKLRQTWTDLKFKFQTRKLTLPVNVAAIVVVDDFSNISSILISLKSDDKGWTEMNEYAADLKERLLAINDVSRVNILGRQKEEIAVIADTDRMSAYGINSGVMSFNFLTEGLNLPAGNFPIGDEFTKIYLREGITSVEDISQQIVFDDPTGGVVRVDDVATVERRLMEKTSSIKYNGDNTLLMSVSMRPNKDIVAFGAKVDKVLHAFEAELPDSVELTRVTDQPKVVRTSILNFLRDLLISILVVVLVMLMLFPFKSAIIASTGVPACTAIAIALMYLMGLPLNTVTLAALIVVLGMIVDDSIITMDGYMDKVGKYPTRLQAATASCEELFIPMLMSTLSISLMLFPLLIFAVGNIGDVFGMFPWILALALLISLAYAVLVVPSMEVRFIAGPSDDEPKGKFAKIQDAFFGALQKVYDKGEKLVFRFPKATIITGVVIIAAGFFVFTKLNVQFLPKASRDLFVAEMFLDDGHNLQHTQEEADSLAALFRQDRRVRNVTTFVGASAPRFHATYAPGLPSRNYAQFIINTTSDKATDELIGEFEEKYEFYFDDAVVHIKQMDYQVVSSPAEVIVKGKNREDLYAVAEKIKGFFSQQGDIVKWVHSDYETAAAVNVNLHRDDALKMGINPVPLSLSLAQDYGATSLLNLSQGDEETIPVILYSDKKPETYDDLGNKMVKSVIPGIKVPLRSIADLEPGWVPTQLVRSAGTDASIAIAADIKSKKSLPAFMKRFRKWSEENLTDLPEGVTVAEGGLTAVNKELTPMLVKSFIAALLIIFLFLLITFKKFNIPVLTMVLSLLCIFGAFVGLLMFDQDFSMTALLGLISLIGIIVRNGIMMFEYAEALHFKEGYTYKDAAMLAGARRMRPIFLTSCTTALGVLPMIISGDALWMPMGLVICFGVLITLPFIVLIMPVAYWQLFARRDKADEK